MRCDRTPRSTQKSLNTQSRSFSASSAVSALIVVILCASCGKKGPPLPPLVRLPAAPAEITAERRGDDVIVQFNVPNANTDNTRPANLSQADVFGFTGPASVTDDQLLKQGVKVGSVAVRKPRDPDQTIDEDESASDLEPLEGDGLDQGARARVEERLTAAALAPVDPMTPSERKRARITPSDAAGPLLGPASPGISTRTYVAVGISTRGRKGPSSTRVAVPLVPPPPAPGTPTVTYNETAITVEWTPVEPSDTDVLPSHPLGTPLPTLAYHVYDVPAPAGSGSSRTLPDASAPSIVSGLPASARGAGSRASGDVLETRLTKEPLVETSYSDARITWGDQRCYAVRAVEMIDALSVESDERPATCVTLKDTFPPAPPKGLSGVASDGAISLIWEPSAEKDLAGYLVLRAPAPSSTLEPVTLEPIPATNFEDKVQAGVRYVYAIVAVDKAGNRSAPSNRLEETAR